MHDGYFYIFCLLFLSSANFFKNNWQNIISDRDTNKKQQHTVRPAMGVKVIHRQLKQQQMTKAAASRQRVKNSDFNNGINQ